MDPTIVVALITAAGVVLAAVFTFAGIRYTQRQARAAAERTDALERTKVAVIAYERAQVTWEAHIENLQEQLTELRTNGDRDRTTIRELKDRVAELEAGRDADKAQIRRLSTDVEEIRAYARQLLSILREHDIPYPPPPVQLAEDGS